MQELSDYQRRALLKNPNVEKITDKHVVYTSKFKVYAVEEYLRGISSNDIFLSKQINPEFFRKNYCKYCLKRWKKKYLEYGKESFDVDHRGSGKSRGRSKKPTYEELEAIVAIQREALGYAKK